MEIITENGKDYLISNIAKRDNSTIDANEFFVDAQELLQLILKKHNNLHKTSTSYIAKGYGSTIQSVVQRFSGDYMSPSFMKGYTTNPALNLVQTFFVEEANDATAIGSTVHKCLEEYYLLPKEERERVKLWEIEKNCIGPNQNKEKVDHYIEGYINIKDYLHPRSELDDKTLECVTEHRGRAQNLYVKSCGYTIPCAVSYVADRIDYRDGEAIILDYKTGKQDEHSVTFDGYLGSMLLYKWAMEQELNTTITKGYLICPGNTASKKYLQLDYSKENEEKMVEQIDRFYKNFMRDKRSREYVFTGNGYFTSDDAKAFRRIMMDNTLWNAKIPVKLYIGEHEESLLGNN